MREQWRQKFNEILDVDSPRQWGNAYSRTFTMGEQENFSNHLYDFLVAEKIIIDPEWLCRILVDTERMRSQYNRAIEILRRLNDQES